MYFNKKLILVLKEHNPATEPECVILSHETSQHNPAAATHTS